MYELGKIRLPSIHVKQLDLQTHVILFYINMLCM